MEHSEKASVPPEQTGGVSKDFEETLLLETTEDAEDMFVLAKERLLQVNSWHEVSTSFKSKFVLTDRQGHELHRSAHKGDFISIDIPAPGSNAGDGQDWVMVDLVAYDDYPDENREQIALRLRPVSNPLNNDSSVAHFFTDDATSTFIIERKQHMLVARYAGRNEKPNVDTETLTDTVRNIAVAVGAILGFSDLQWKGLLKGFLATE